eukprot:TCONS_00055734-protein
MYVTTLVHEKRPNDKQAVADLLSHNVSTAENIYRQKKMIHQAVRAAEVIQSVTNANSSNEKNPEISCNEVEKKKSTETDCTSTLQSNDCDSIHLETSNKRSKEDASEASNDDSDSDIDDRSVVAPSSTVSSGKDKLFTVVESHELYNMAMDLIRNPPINEERINEVLKKTSCGKQFLLKFNTFQLENKMKYGRRLFRMADSRVIKLKSIIK